LVGWLPSCMHEAGFSSENRLDGAEPFLIFLTEPCLEPCKCLSRREAVPGFVAEVAQRVLELLKIFNSRTCQLVLGAGAMQVGGV
jgi:hypothetical protein